MSTSLPEPVNYHLLNSLGPFALGAVLNAYCSGWVWSLGFQYYRRWPLGDDRKAFGYSVGALMILDMFGTILAVYNMFKFCIVEWGNLNFLMSGKSTVGFQLNPALVGVVAVIVQTFYAYRVWVVNGRNKFIPVIILFFAVIQLGFACGGTYITFAYQIQQWRKHYTWGVLIWLGSAAVSDLLITGSIVYYLRKAQKTSSFHETNSLLDKIIRSTMENNLLTACVALMDGITFASNGTSWHITMNQVLPKLYTLSFIITLNARVPTSDLASNHPSTRARSLQQGPDLTMTNSMVKSRISGSHADHRPKPSPILVDFPSYRWSGKFSRTEIFPLIVLSGNNVSLTSSGRRARLFLTKKRFSAEWQRFGSSNPQSTNNKRSTL